MTNEQTIKYLTTKTVFTVTIIVAVLTILGVWLFGLGQHRSLYDNSILSTTILSVCLFLFLTVGLFKGVKLKDDIGRLTDRLKPSKIPEFLQPTHGTDFFPVGEGIGGVIISIVLWLVVTILIALFLWIFGVVLWTGIIVFIAMLYWIFFRAVRLVFKNSNKCKGNFRTSITYGLFYTLLYNFWIYTIIFGTQYLTMTRILTTNEIRMPTANTRLAQWGLTSLIGSLCFYCKFVLVDSLVFQNPPLSQAWER